MKPPVMTDDTSTAYICIYCPFNSDNLEALEHHIKSTHEHGCQDAPQPLAQSPSSPNITNKANKREVPDDEQRQSSYNGIKQTTGQSPAVKRIKRTSSPMMPTNIFINNIEDNSGGGGDDDDDDFDDDENDERDSVLHSSDLSSTRTLTCPSCGSTYNSLEHLIRHAKHKHHMDLTNSEQPHVFTVLPIQANQSEISDIEENTKTKEDITPTKADDIKSTEISFREAEEPVISSVVEPNATTDCPYCDYKTTDIEQFKLHIVAHIRDKNYRCLLCNRLYKYRGDCSFHIRRKHHRYSVNSNDYIQRFFFDTSDGDETMSTQSGAYGSTSNGAASTGNTSREQDEPLRYFGCPYCDYTSNYGGDVRKHQARKHPNLESKVVKIIRQDAEQQIHPVSSDQNQDCAPIENDEDDDDDDDDEDDSSARTKPTINSTAPHERKEKIKTVKRTDTNFIQHHHQPALPILPNFAPVRVFQCSSCHQQGTYKWVVERHIRAKHPDQPEVHVIELPAELAVKLQKISPPLKRFRCSLCPLQSKHTWVIIRHIKHFHTLQTASVLDIRPDGTPVNDESFSFQNGDYPSKSYNPDSESSSISSSFNETGPDGQVDLSRQQDIENEDNESVPVPSSASSITIGTMAYLYKCSLCDFTSSVPWTIPKHISDFHPGQPSAHMLKQYRSIITDHNQKAHTKKSKSKQGNHIITETVSKMPIGTPLSPMSALAKAKFSPAVEEALLSLQGSKINSGIYTAQPKFGIKRLKCRHCFYRSNWKTDMIRHVRIRHNLTEPDHNRDMIVMSEQEARSTIETYENTFGKELRRRTFRTWNDWAKAEEEFTPKDGSLQYTDINGGTLPNDNKGKKTTITIGTVSSSTGDDNKRVNKPKVKQNPKTISQTLNKNEEFKQLPNPSNIVSRLLLTASPSHSNDDDVPLDLSFKPSSIGMNQQNGINNHQEIADVDDDEETSDQTSTVNYLCSVCPYKRSNLSLVEHHLSLHFMGQGVVCPICSYTALSANSIVRHMTIVHPTSQTVVKFPPAPQIPLATIVEQHQCLTCPYQCENAEALDVHRRLEHDDEEFDIDSSSSIAGEDEMDNDHIHLPVDRNNDIFQCPLCTTNYSDLEQFTMHIFTNHDNHIHNNQSCPFCSFIALSTSAYTLLEHIKLHFNGTLVQPDPTIGMENVKELFIE